MNIPGKKQLEKIVIVNRETKKQQLLGKMSSNDKNRVIFQLLYQNQDQAKKLEGLVRAYNHLSLKTAWLPRE